MPRRRWVVAFLAVVALVLGVAWFQLGPSIESGVGDIRQTPQGNPTCENSDKTNCPESYFTGPLGERNLVPHGTGAFLIEYYGGVGTNWADIQSAVQERQTYIGRKFDGVQIQYDGAATWDGVFGMPNPTDISPSREQWILDNGSFVAISWTPDYTVGQINNGAADAIWTKAADYWKTFSPRQIMLRPFAEFNLPQMSGAFPSPKNGYANYCGAPFIKAWQRMVEVFRKQGATNVGFWFSPDEGNNRPCIVDSYPGDGYVDWVGSDSYNRCSTGEQDCYSTPLRPGPATFEQLFAYRGICADDEECNPSLIDLFGPRKPFVVGEVGTIYDPASPQSKGNFYRTVPQAAKNMKYLRGVSFFDADVSAIEGPETNWRVDSPLSQPDVYAGFRQMATDAWFRSGPNGRTPN